MILSTELLEGSIDRLPQDINSLIARAKDNPSILINPPEVLRKRAVLQTEAMVPANIVRERILGGNDYQDMNYFQRGIETSTAVCRIFIKLPNGVSYGTGFLICDHLIMTNNHVLRDAGIAADAVAEFDFELDSNNNYKQITRVNIDPSAFFYTNESLDYTIVAIRSAQKDRKKIRLIHETGKAVYNESLSIIQHPDGREKKIAVRNNTYINSTDTTLWYTTDTSPGSSGSPVFNDDWQLVAIHHSGVPERTTDGKYVLVDGSLVTSINDIQESKIKWKANEGIRISIIVDDLKNQLSNGSLAHFHRLTELEDIIQHTVLENAIEVDSAGILPKQSEITQMMQNKQVQPAVKLHTGGIQIIVNIGADQLNRPEVADTYQAVEIKEPKPKIKVVIDSNYSNRIGYADDFMNRHLPLADIVNDVYSKKNIELSPVLKYHHFSIYQAGNGWQMPYITAVNIDGGLFKDYNRPQDAWFLDPRLKDGFGQIDNQTYKNNNLDRGHMVRREDPSWGTEQEALLATFDTYHYTNACPQHAKLNQGKMEWQGLENYILDMAVSKELKVNVYTGPVLIEDPNEYEEYRGVRVPMQFFKVVVVNTADDVYAAGYLLSQYKHRGDFEAAYDPTVDQRPISDIVELTALNFTGLADVDTFRMLENENRFKLQEKFYEDTRTDKTIKAFRVQTLADIALGLKKPY